MRARLLARREMTDGSQRQYQSTRRWDDGETAVTMREMVLAHDRDIDDLKIWRNELAGAMKLLKLTLGANIATGILAVLAIVGLISGAMK